MELDNGRQGYVVCPLIEESEKMDLQNVEETYEILENIYRMSTKLQYFMVKCLIRRRMKLLRSFLKKRNTYININYSH